LNCLHRVHRLAGPGRLLSIASFTLTRRCGKIVSRECIYFFIRWPHANACITAAAGFGVPS
jgi:hypothetical protein